MRSKQEVWEELKVALEFLEMVRKSTANLVELDKAVETVERLYLELGAVTEAEDSNVD